MSYVRRFSSAGMVFLGSVSWAASQWFIVWLFARFAGGSESVGVYASLLAVVMPVFVLAQLGLRTVYLTLSVDVAWRVYRTVRVCAVLVVSLLLMPLLLVVHWLDDISVALALLILKSMDSVLDLYMGRLQRRESFIALGALTIANSLSTVILSAAVILATGSIAGALLGSATASMAIVVIAARLGAQPDGADARGDVRAALLTVRSGLPVALSQGVALMAAYLPTLLLASLFDAAAVGVYAAAAYLITAANLLGASLQILLLTSFRRIYESQGPQHLFLMAVRSALPLLAVGLAGGIAVARWGNEVVKSVYGDSFEVPGAGLVLLAIGAALVAPSYMFSMVLVVLNAYGAELYIWIAAVVVGLGGGLVGHWAGLPAVAVGSLAAMLIYAARLAGVALAASRCCTGKVGRSAVPAH